MSKVKIIIIPTEWWAFKNKSKTKTLENSIKLSVKYMICDTWYACVRVFNIENEYSNEIV